MLNIEIKDADELYKITLDLAIITYLQELVANESVCGDEAWRDLKLQQVDITNFLLEHQQNQMKLLQELIRKENFAI